MGQISQLLGQTVHTAVHPTAGHWLRGLVSTTHAHHHHHHHLWVPLHGTTASITEKRQQQSFKWCVWLLQGAVHTEEHVDLLGKYRAATSGSSSVMSSRYIPSVPKCWLLFSNGRQTLKALHVLWSSQPFQMICSDTELWQYLSSLTASQSFWWDFLYLHDQRGCRDSQSRCVLHLPPPHRRVPHSPLLPERIVLKSVSFRNILEYVEHLSSPWAWVSPSCWRQMEGEAGTASLMARKCVLGDTGMATAEAGSCFWWAARKGSCEGQRSH